MKNDIYKNGPITWDEFLKHNDQLEQEETQQSNKMF